MNHKKTIHIAIDGPVAAGKGTVAKKLADHLGLIYVDTGAMYRAVALLGIKHNISLEDEVLLANLINGVKLEMRNPNKDEKDGRQTTIIANGEDISWAIRTEEVSNGASKVATLPQIRQVLVKKQQEIAQENSVVMEGRDITFRVLPNAELKIYLTANPEVRATRRAEQLRQRGLSADIEAVLKDLKARDKQDMSRGVDPLQITKDAWVIDTSSLTIDQVVKKITLRVEQIQDSVK